MTIEKIIEHYRKLLKCLKIWRKNRNSETLKRLNPNQLKKNVESFQCESFENESNCTSDSFDSVRIKNLVRIHSVWSPVLNRIEPDWFLTDMLRTRIKFFFRLVRNDSKRFEIRFRNVLEQMWFDRIEFKFKTFVKVFKPRLAAWK